MYCTGGIRCRRLLHPAQVRPLCSRAFRPGTLAAATPFSWQLHPCSRGRCTSVLLAACVLLEGRPASGSEVWGAACRCRERGYKNLYSLEGGVARYLKEEGPSFWKGHLFVFDARLAVPPGPAPRRQGGVAGRGRSIVRCTLCSGELEQVRHSRLRERGLQRPLAVSVLPRAPRARLHSLLP